MVKQLDGSGNITVNTLNGNSAADLSGITTSGTNNNHFNADVTSFMVSLSTAISI